MSGDLHLAIRTHNLPTYGFYEREYEDTEEWFDEWWSMFVDINLTKKVVEDHYSSKDYDGFEVIIDE